MPDSVDNWGLDRLKRALDAAPQWMVDAVFRDPANDGRLLKVLVAALRTDDARLRTRARRALEERGWDRLAYDALDQHKGTT